ncbi:hypothetical protein Tco_0871073 [Tanacetum coccineum]
MMYLHRILDVFCLLEIIFPECCSQIFIAVNGFLPWELSKPDSKAFFVSVELTHVTPWLGIFPPLCLYPRPGLDFKMIFPDPRYPSYVLMEAGHPCPWGQTSFQGLELGEGAVLFKSFEEHCRPVLGLREHPIIHPPFWL